MSIDLTSNHFELFEQTPAFAIDEAALASRYHRLQQMLHPDRFATASDAERRWSVQAVSAVNDAYTTLKSPLKRAVYLLSLQGVDLDEETDTSMDPMFLMTQLELRESLEAAESASDPYAALDKVSRAIREAEAEQQSGFTAAADAADWGSARNVARQWQFLDKLQREVSAIESRLDDRE